MGQLDIDMNAGVDLTDRPVENIFWPYDSAPAGSYEVYVNYFARHGDPDPTPYTVRTLVNGRVSNYAGSLEFGDEPNLVTTFNVPAGPWRFLGLRAGAWIAALVVGVWLAVCAAALTLGLNEGVRAWHRANDPGSVAPRRPTAPLRAALAAFLVGACCQLLYGTLAGWKPVLAGDARLVVWTLFGGIAAGLLHQWVPRLPAIVAVVAGALAAFASAAFFNGMPPGGDAPGRFFFATLWGFAIGLLIYLVRVPAPEPEIEELPSLQLEAMRLQPYRLTPGRLVGSGMRDG
jgi:hypothetical protein